MNYYKLSNNTLTLKSGYFISGISILLIIFLWSIIDSFSNYYKSETSYNSLKLALNNNKYEEAKSISLERLSPSISHKIVNSIFLIFPKLTAYANTHHIPLTIVTSDILDNIFNFIILLDKNDIDKATNELKTLSSKNSQIKDAKTFNQIISNILKILETTKLENNNIRKKEDEEKKYKTEIAKLEKRHALLADEFALFLSLSPAYEKGSELNVYKSGVLAGLPILKNLKDGIPTLPDLKNELDKIGGNVNIQAQNAYEVFTGRLLSIQESSKQMRNESQRNMNKIELLRQEKKQSNKILENNKIYISKNIKKLILNLNK